ncbi:UL36 very large tegument protein [Streptomyces sp. NPDC003027]
MSTDQLPAAEGAFARLLRDLVARLDPGEGWYGVFASRDPDGMRACFDGTEILPWDVVESLLHDLGEAPSGPQGVRVRALHTAAAAAHDRRPGGAEALRERLELMERERCHAATRSRELEALLGAAPGSPDTPRLQHELAWARDDHRRATARIEELAARLTALAQPAPAPAVEPAPAPAPARTPAPAVKRRPRGARYAWMDEADDVPEAVGVPRLPVAGALPRGARFGGAETTPAAPPRTPAAPLAAEVAAEAARAAGNAVYALRRLRAQGRSGEAHALLCEAVAGPPAWLPPLAAELDRVGLGADWTTLLWEAATLPPGRLAAVAGALADAGRDQDCDQLLRQGVARPVEELADACAALRAEGHQREARALLAAFLRARTPEDAARLAAVDPHALVPQLLDAAHTVSPDRRRDLAHALRVAGLAGA